MKITKVLLLSVCFAGASQVGGLNAQLGKLKVKKPSISLPGSKSNDDNVGEIEDDAKDKPEYNPNDPIYKSYATVRDNLKSAKNTLEGSDWKSNTEGSNENVLKDLKKAKEHLTKLEEAGESKKKYYKSFESSYKDIEAKREAEMKQYNEVAVYEIKLEAYYKWAAMDWEIKNESVEPSYKGYKTFRADLETNKPDKFKESYTQKRVQAIDNFFNEEVYKSLPIIEKKLDAEIKDIHKKNVRGEEDYKLNVTGYIKDLNELKEELDYLDEFLLEDKTEVNRIQTKLQKEKTALEDYVNSGEYQTYRAKYEKEVIDGVRLNKRSALHTDKYESMALAGVENGTGIKANVYSTVWGVKKNNIDIPVSKSLSIDIAIKRGDKCFLSYGQIKRNYEGGGKYGGEYFEYLGSREEMNCDNVNK